jgi:small ligand-binding sensory domain FIST
MTVCASSLSAHPLPTQATGEVVGEVLERLGAEPDVAVLFASPHHTGAIEDIGSAVRSLLRPGVLVGCTSGTVVGGPEEVEDGPALALFAARGIEATGLRIQAVPGADGVALWGLPRLDPGDGRTLVVLADPYTFPATVLLDAAGEAGVQVVGGLAGAARSAGGNRLLLDGAVHDDGAVALLLPAEAGARAIVSQGCRPVGDPMVVTKAEGNLIEELASEPALVRLRRLIANLTEEERRLAAQGLHIGKVVDERKDRFERGDFLIRAVLGAVTAREAVAVGEDLPIGTTVQFQVRDADSADEDLRHLLAGAEAAGALLFTCNGRGSHLFGAPDHDAALVDAVTPGRATAGMSCAGEIGPIGGTSFLHGFTASALLFQG